MISDDMGGNEGEKRDSVGLSTVFADTGHCLILSLEADLLGCTGKEFMGS